jgi:hypothetical protein
MLKSKLLVLVFILLIISSIGGTSILAGGPKDGGAPPLLPLPPIPDSTIINSVINKTGGPTYTPLGIPDFVKGQLDDFANFFGLSTGYYDEENSVSYLQTDKSLLEIVMPLKNSGNATLAPDMTAPGLDPQPGKVIGATFQPKRGTMIIVAIFNPSNPGSIPETLRFYYTSEEYYEHNLYHGVFTETNGSIDYGALIGHSRSCVVLGDEQVCWDPYSESDLRDNSVRDIAYTAYSDFKYVYDFSFQFFLDDALPDLIGSTHRTNCANELKTATKLNRIRQCAPNLVFTASTDVMPNQPIGLWVVLQPADLKVYSTSGDFIGSLPPGEYLVLDATPTDKTPGKKGVLFLVNVNAQNHYLIPSKTVRGFAVMGGFDQRQAAIKDGTMSFRGF